MAPTIEARNAISTAVGINGSSILMEAPWFDVTTMLGQDFMHDILEGGLGMEIRLFLNYCIYDQQFFTLDQLNSRIGDSLPSTSSSSSFLLIVL